MAKNRKYEGDNQAQAANADATAHDVPSQVVDAAAAVVSNLIAKPATFLKADADGVEFKFDLRAQLPKKAPVAGSIFIDDQPCDFQVTSNKGWTPPENVIEYIWVTLPNGKSGFITLDYLVPALTYALASFKVGTGKANRTNPDRIPKSLETEEKRKAAAKETLAKNKALKEAAAAEQAAVDGEAEQAAQAQ